MARVVAFSILALTVTASLCRPTVWRLQIGHAKAAVVGALLCITLQIVPLSQAVGTLRFLSVPVITIISLMVITLVAEEAGLFSYLAHNIAKAAGGNARTLFTYLFFAGTVTGAVFTNDAAVLIFTPLVFRLIEDVQGDSWTLSNKIPFYFAVLYVANVVGVFVISNPINIIVSRFFDISFLDYARWMIVPALMSIVTTYWGLKLAFRRHLPQTFTQLGEIVIPASQRKATVTCAIVLFVTLIAFFSEELTGIPTWAVALSSALVLLGFHGLIFRSSYSSIIKGVGWDVIIFVVGIFLIVEGVRNAGLTAHLGELLKYFAGGDLSTLTHVTGFTAGGISAIMNNHPTAGTMAVTIGEMHLPALEEKMLVFSGLIGGDLGPKMLPTGSLAALMWFRILRNKGVHVSYWLYVKIGVPITLAAIGASVLTLNVERLIYGLFG